MYTNIFNLLVSSVGSVNIPNYIHILRFLKNNIGLFDITKSKTLFIFRFSLVLIGFVLPD